MASAPPTTPRGRWLLRGMIAAVVLLVLIGLAVPWLRVRWAAAQVARYRAQVQFGPSASASLDKWMRRRDLVGLGPVTGISRDDDVPLSRPETEQLIRLVGYFPDLKLLDIRQSQLVGSDYETFGRLRNLGILNLSGCPVEGRFLDALGDCPSLFSLEITNTRIDQGLIDAIGRLKQLQFVDLSGSRLTGLDLSPLCQLTNLRLLVLDQTEVTDAEIETLADLTKLGGLSLSGNNVSEEAISRLRERVPIDNYSDD